jgi:WD40 repeat protein
VATVAVVQRGRADEAASVAETAAAEAEAQRSAAERATAEADELRGSAEQRALVDGARAAGLAAVELAGDDPETAVLVALEAAWMAEQAGASVPEVVRGLWAGAINQQRIRAEFDVGHQAFSQFGQGVTVSPDGRWGVSTLAVEGSAESAAWLDAGERTRWSSTTTVTDLATGAVVSTLGDDGGLPLFSTWDPTTGEVVTANGEGALAWWDPERGVLVRREELTSGPLWHVVLSDDRLATSENIDQSDGESIAVLRDRSTMEPIAEVPRSLWSTLSPDGRWWATFSMSSEIVFHDAGTGVEVARVQHRMLWPQEAVGSADWAGNDDAMWFRPIDGSVLQRIELGGDASPTVVTELGLRTELSDGAQTLRTSPDGGLIALGNADNRIHIIDAETGEQVVAFSGHVAVVESLDWLPDGSGLVSVDGSGTSLVWDIGPASGTPMSSVRVANFPHTHAQFADGSVLVADQSGSGALIDPVTGAAIVEFGPADTSRSLRVFANEDAGIFVAPSDPGVRLYDVGERRWSLEVSEIEGVDHPLALSADGTRLLAGTAPSSPSTAAPVTVMIDTTTGEVLWRIDQYMTGVAVITDDVVLATRIQTRGAANRLAVLDIERGDELAASTRSWTTSAMTVSPDGSHLATVRDGAGLIVYDLDVLVERSKAQAVATSEPDSATGLIDERIVHLVYSPDGSVLFSGSDSGVLRAWDATTLEERWSIDNGNSMAGLRVDDDRVWFGQPIGGDGPGGGGFGLAAIPFDQESIADWAASTVSRDLTDRECQEFLGRPCAARPGQP